MIKIKRCLTIIIVFLVATHCNAQMNLKTSVKEFAMLEGNWQGTLTYLDYSSGKPYTMAADIDIKRIKKTNKFIFSNSYPNEKSANSIDTITISEDGHFIDKELVKSSRKLANSDREIITEEPGKDGNDNKPATIRHTYTFGAATYKNRKDVRFEGATDWINRNEYFYKKTAR